MSRHHDDARRRFSTNPIAPGDILVVPTDLDRRLRPVPQSILKDPLVSDHLRQAGAGEGSSVFGLALHGLLPGQKIGRPLATVSLRLDAAKFTNGLELWNAEAPLLVYDALLARAWVLWELARWELAVPHGPLGAVVDAWLAEPGVPDTLVRASKEFS